MARSIDVLVIDDRSIDADVTLFALQRAAPAAKVLRLKSGEEALSYLFAVGEFARRSGGPPGLVLLDKEMPVISGLCILDIIRAHPATSGICVVMLSTDSHPHVFKPPARFAANAYVVKPVDLDRYCAAIEKTLGRWLPRVLPGEARRTRPAVRTPRGWSTFDLYPT
jgi:two-component system, response regulator